MKDMRERREGEKERKRQDTKKERKKECMNDKHRNDSTL